MSGGQEQMCNACDGAFVTDKEQHSVELDEYGHQVPVVRRFTSPCTQCHGTGKVSG